MSFLDINIKKHNKWFNILLYSTYLLYGVVLLGLSSSAPKYLEILNFIFQLYVAIILILRFRNRSKNDFDGKIGYNGGLLLLWITLIGGVR